MKFMIKSGGSPHTTKVILRMPNGDEHDLTSVVSDVEIRIVAGSPFTCADVTIVNPELDLECERGSLVRKA